MDEPPANNNRRAEREQAADKLRVAIRLVGALRGITLAELARRAGLRNANTLHNFLNGHSRGLTWHTFTRLREAFPELDDLGARNTTRASLSLLEKPTWPGRDWPESIRHDQLVQDLRRLSDLLRTFRGHLDATCAELERFLSHIAPL